MSFLRSLKDKALSLGAEKILKSKFERYGEMLELKIDSEEKNIHIKMELKGENEPLSATIKGYRIAEKNGADYFQFNEVITSKEWMNLLAEDFLKKKEIKLKDEIPGFVKMLL